MHHLRQIGQFQHIHVPALTQLLEIEYTHQNGPKKSSRVDNHLIRELITARNNRNVPQLNGCLRAQHELPRGHQNRPKPPWSAQGRVGVKWQKLNRTLSATKCPHNRPRNNRAVRSYRAVCELTSPGGTQERPSNRAPPPSFLYKGMVCLTYDRASPPPPRSKSCPQQLCPLLGFLGVANVWGLRDWRNETEKGALLRMYFRRKKKTKTSEENGRSLVMTQSKLRTKLQITDSTFQLIFKKKRHSPVCKQKSEWKKARPNEKIENAWFNTSVHL